MLAIASVVIDDAMAGLPEEEIHELGEQCLTHVHGSLQKKTGRQPKRLSSFKAETPFIALNPASVMTLAIYPLHLTGHY